MQQVCAALGGDHPDRTLRSYIMQDREAASREAKVAWAVREGWHGRGAGGVPWGLDGGVTWGTSPR